jgi:hypothetical protein
MNTSGQTLLIGDPDQERGEIPAFGGGQRGKQVSLGRSPNCCEFRDHGRTGRAEVKQVNAPVAIVATTLDQTARFEVIDQRDHAARRQSKRIRDSLLAAAGMLADGMEHSDVWRDQAERLDALCELG